MFNKIDIQTWHRKELLQHFSEYPCSFSATISLDVTSLLPYIKQNQLKLYPILITLISQVVNNLQEFKMSYKDSDIGFYDFVHPVYTIPRIPELFSIIWSEYNSDFVGMYRQVSSDIDRNSAPSTLIPTPLPSNCFHISCLPELPFTSFHLSLMKESSFLSPIFTIGQYQTINDKTSLPLAIQVNHIVCDGYHLTKFTQELQKQIDSISHNMYNKNY